MAFGFCSLKMGREPGLPSHFQTLAGPSRYVTMSLLSVASISYAVAKIRKKVVVTKFFRYFLRKKVTTTMATAIIISIAIIL